MRVIAGKAKSIRLKTPAGSSTRPTTDRIKETLFNMLQPYLYESSFLDLFSGSGGIAIEALSRGARDAVLVEKNREALACIRENLKNTRLEGQARVLAGDILQMLPRMEGRHRFDVVFMDPPYNMEWEKRILTFLADSGIIHEDTLIVTEASLETDFSYLEALGYEIRKRKAYKTNQHLFLSKVSVPPERRQNR